MKNTDFSIGSIAKLIVCVVLFLNAGLGSGQAAQPRASFRSKASIPTITPDKTQAFSLNHHLFSATFFKGKSYNLYTLDSKSHLELSDLSISPDLSVSQTNEYEVTNSGSYTSGTLVALGDTLYAFWRNGNTDYVWYRPYILNGTGLTAGTARQVQVDLPKYSGADHFDTFIAATMYQNNIYLLVEGNASGDDKLYVVKGALDPGTQQLVWTYVDYVRDNDGNIISVNSSYSNNTDSYDITTIHSSAGTDSLVVGRANSSKITLHLFRGANNWKTYQKTTPVDISSNFKMIQGAIVGLGSDQLLALQCIGKNDTYTYSEVFDVDNRAFVAEGQLPQHIGTFTPCVNMIKNDDSFYSQYINILTGDLSNDLNVDTYASNKIYCSIRIINNPDTIIDTPNLRGLATLVGVIEGPPPSILETQADYDQNNNKYGSPATLTKETSNTTSTSTTTTYTGGAEVKGGNCFASVTLAYEREQARTTGSTRITNQTISMGSTKIQDRDSATLVYNVPKLIHYSYYLCTPSSTMSSQIPVITTPILTEISTGEISAVTRYMSLKAAPFNISDPRILSNWLNRPAFQNRISNTTSYQVSNAPFDFKSATITNGIDNIQAVTTNVSNKASVSIDLSFLSFLNVKVTASYKVEKTKSSTFEDALNLTYQKYVSDSEISGNKYTAFSCDFALITDQSPIAAQYYTALRSANVCLTNESPWIITYNINNIKYKTSTNIAETATSKDFDLKLYRQSESTVAVVINSQQNDLLTVELYSLSGQKMKTLYSQQPITAGSTTLTSDCSLPKGIYLVKSYTSQQIKSSLVNL